MFLEERLNDIKKEFGYNNKQLEEKLNLANGYINDVEKGKNRNPSKVITALYEKLRISPNWIYSGDGPMFLSEKENLPTTMPVKIPLLRQTVSCGPGQTWEESDAVESYIEPLGFFPALTRAKVYAFRVSGVSMTGVGIMDGDVVLFDANPEQNLRDDIYVFAWGGEVYCKLLRFDKLKKEIYIYSVMNRDLTEAELLKVIKQDDPATASAFRVFGRVVAWMHENRLMYR